MSEVVTLAEKVVAELEECGAELSFFPEFELRDLDEMRVVVVPVGTQYKTLSRSSHEELPRVQIGILKRGSEEELPELLKFVEDSDLDFSIKNWGLQRVFALPITLFIPQITCVSADNSPA